MNDDLGWSGFRFLPLARAELDAAYARYESTLPGLGERFLDELLLVIDDLRRYPRHGYHSADVGYGRVNLRHFPYAVIYSIEPDGILIRVIGHQRRHPDFLKP